MSEAIEFWFDFGSPYAYFAAELVEERLAPFGRPVEWKPFLLGAAFPRTGMQPLSLTPMRGDYARRDWVRLATVLGRPFRLSDAPPLRSQVVARAFYWMRDHRPAAAIPFARAAFRACFEDGVDLERPAAVMGLAVEAGADAAAMEAWLASPEARARLFAVTEEALARGVFGSPFFVADGEPFWGHDRLPMLERWLRDGGWSRGR